MDGDPTREPGMWQQFRQRRVTRTVLLYLVFAFAAIEAAVSATDVLRLPEWGMRAVVGVIVLGFPFTVVLAWTYDITPGGVVRTPDDLEPDEADVPRGRIGWVVFALGALAAGLILHLQRG